ncbi:MAG TPA: hypothetical protein VGG41_02880 [Solirubrobacteraceae bacterium]|jgi:hypothetical protein
MTSRIARVFVAVLAAASLVGTATADAHLSKFQKRVRAALRDCSSSSNGSLKGHYSLKVLQAAFNDVKAEQLQYTGCADVLTAAIRADTLGTPKPHHVTTHPTGTATTPVRKPVIRSGQKQIKSHVKKLSHEGGKPLTLPTGQTVTPGAVTAHSASFLSGLPTPLLIVLAALLAVVVAVGGRAIQNLVRARRSR